MLHFVVRASLGAWPDPDRKGGIAVVGHDHHHEPIHRHTLLYCRKSHLCVYVLGQCECLCINHPMLRTHIFCSVLPSLVRQGPDAPCFYFHPHLDTQDKHMLHLAG